MNDDITNLPGNLFSLAQKSENLKSVACSTLVPGDLIAVQALFDSAVVIKVTTDAILNKTTVRYSSRSQVGYVETAYDSDFKLFKIERSSLN